MTPELIGILSVGATLFALNLALWRLLAGRVERLESRLRGDVATLDRRLSADIASLRADVHDLAGRVSSLEQRVSRVEGLIEGLFVGAGNGGTRRRERAD